MVTVVDRTTGHVTVVGSDFAFRVDVTDRTKGGREDTYRRKANERLLQGVPTMLRELFRLATDETKSDVVRLAAIRDWLDRAGITSKTVVEVEAKWETIIHGIVAEVPDDDVPPLPAGYRQVDPDVIAGQVDSSYIEEPDEPGDEIHIVEGGDVFDLGSGARLSPSRLAKFGSGRPAAPSRPADR